MHSQGSERHDTIDRAILCALALIPAGMGIFALLNNLSGWQETVQRMVFPMFNMEGTFGNSYQTWRAIDSLAFAHGAYLLVFAIEGLFGMVAIAGLIRMLRNLSKPGAGFRAGVRIVRTACMIAMFIYGFIFFTVGGDWFLAWQNPNLGGLQRDAVNYGIIVTLSYIALDSHLRAT